MKGIIDFILMNLGKVGFSIVLFMLAYVSNIIMGVWKNVKIEGNSFDYKILINSVFKFIVLVLGIGLLTIAVSLVPVYATYIGIVIEEEAIAMIDSLVISTAFLTATVRYAKDALNKLFTILGNT